MTITDDLTAALKAIYLQTAQEGLEKAKIERSLAETQRAHLDAFGQQSRRPWRLLNAVVGFDDSKNQWKTEFQGVVAWGDTPEMACDNFDHCWMFGDGQ